VETRHVPIVLILQLVVVSQELAVAEEALEVLLGDDPVVDELSHVILLCTNHKNTHLDGEQQRLGMIKSKKIEKLDRAASLSSAWRTLLQWPDKATRLFDIRLQHLSHGVRLRRKQRKQRRRVAGVNCAAGVNHCAAGVNHCDAAEDHEDEDDHDLRRIGELRELLSSHGLLKPRHRPESLQLLALDYVIDGSTSEPCKQRFDVLALLSPGDSESWRFLVLQRDPEEGERLARRIGSWLQHVSFVDLPILQRMLPGCQRSMEVISLPPGGLGVKIWGDQESNPGALFAKRNNMVAMISGPMSKRKLNMGERTGPPPPRHANSGKKVKTYTCAASHFFLHFLHSEFPSVVYSVTSLTNIL